MRQFFNLFVLHIFLFIFSMSSFSQTAYYDALKIQKMGEVNPEDGIFTIPPDKRGDLMKILVNYDSSVNETSDPKLVSDKYDANPFITSKPDSNNVKGYIYYDSYNNFFGSAVGKDESSQAVSSIGGLSVTNIADGLAKFLVKRTKEELNVAFFRKFKEVLETYPEFKALFPKTHNFVSFIEEQNYASMLQVLKQAFEDDIKTLLSNIPELRNIECNVKVLDTIGSKKNKRKFEKCSDRVKKITAFFEKEGGWTVWTASLFVDELISGKNAADALSSVFKDRDLKKFDIDKNGNPKDTIPMTYNAFKLLDLFSASLRSKEDSLIWVNAKDIEKEIIENDIQRTIYLGLLYQQSKTRNIRFPKKDKKPIYFHEILREANESQDEIKYFLSELSESITKIENSSERLKELRLKNESLNVGTVDNYLRGINGLFEATSEFLDSTSKKDSSLISKTIVEKMDKLTTSMEYGLSIYSDLEEKDYGSLLFNVTILMDNYMKDDFIFKDNLIKYGTFMATVAQAENSDQVAAAIEAAALPSGSSSIKRKSDFNVSLNAYVGLFVGSEKIIDSGKESTVFGLTSPIGVAVSKGRLNWGPIQGVTLFASIIDIGAITTYRFDDNNDAQDLPELSFENIIAPGIHGYFNFKNLPISVGGGYQLGPSTREINGVDESIRRWHITVAVDIPLMNFYTKSK